MKPAANYITALCIVIASNVSAATPNKSSDIRIVHAADASLLEVVAANEMQRYFYLGQVAFGAVVQGKSMPYPNDLNASNEAFNRTAALLRAAFTHARGLGIKTCLGTETPLTIPKAVQQRLRESCKDPHDASTVQAVYEGIFTRIMRAHPLDYFWLWTPENWTWKGAKPEQVKATTDDLKSAMTAAKNVKIPFTLAMCGWVLGPQNDRTLFDKLLPKDMPISCINRQFGMDTVERGFAEVKERPKWAIPWLEDDPAMTAPQLWVGRKQRDARDALKFGCNGLIGIHWRTRNVGPMVSALANTASNFQKPTRGRSNILLKLKTRVDRARSFQPARRRSIRVLC